MMNRLRPMLVITALLLQLTSFALAQEKNAPPFKVGVATRSFIPPEPYNWRGAQTHALITTIWYPADSAAVEQPQWIGSPNSPFASAGKAANDAALAPSPAKLPLILLSHGTGASALMMAWLGTALASHGYIAAAVNHPGNNALEPYTAQGFSLWWERAKDLSVVLDSMLADSTFGKRIDSGRIGAAGFSLGGFTMIEVAGGIGEPSRYDDFCKSPRADGMCVPPLEFPDIGEKGDELARTDKEFQTSLLDSSKSHRDPRIHAVFAIAPALGPAFSIESLDKISIPVEIVAGAEDSVVPVGSSAQFFAAHIPGAMLTLFPAAGHYTFLATCGDLGRRSRPELCADASGVDRDTIHEEAAELALSFFSDSLVAPSPGTSEPTRVRAGGIVMAAKLIKQPLPVYPDTAKRAGICGKVVLHAIVAKDGSVQQLEYVSGPQPLVKAAMKAVQKWRYAPTILKGQPVEVDTTISVFFNLTGCIPQ
jgi:TonB family protein